MTPQPIDFFDFWSDLDLALDDARLPESGFSRALRLWKILEFTGGDPDKLIAEEIAWYRTIADELEGKTP